MTRRKLDRPKKREGRPGRGEKVVWGVRGGGVSLALLFAFVESVDQIGPQSLLLGSNRRQRLHTPVQRNNTGMRSARTHNHNISLLQAHVSVKP